MTHQQDFNKQLMTTMKTIFFTLLTLIFSHLSIAEDSKSSNYSVIIHPKQPVDSLTLKHIQRLYLGKKRSLNGIRVKPINLEDDHPMRIYFSETILDMDIEGFNFWWARRVFTGKGKPPSSVTSTAEVKKLVAENVKAIGYIKTEEVDNSVKVVYQF